MSAPSLTSADFDRIDALLDLTGFRENALPLDAIQGLLCAVASAPSPIERERWLAAALGTTVEPGADADEDELVALLERFHEGVAASLAAGEGFDFLLYPAEEGSEELDYATWAGGYLEGVGLAEPAWDECAETDDVEDLLMPFDVLAGALDDDEDLRRELDLDPEEEAQLVADCREALPESVQAAYEFWRAKR